MENDDKRNNYVKTVILSVDSKVSKLTHLVALISNTHYDNLNRHPFGCTSLDNIYPSIHRYLNTVIRHPKLQLVC